MTYRRDLERMTTLSSRDIGDACRGDRLPGLINRCIDELLELTELADEALSDDRIEEYLMYTQEVSAWRETAQLLRLMAADESLRGARNRRGAA
ncbi:hypothetical protein [Gordonia hydrophobica]|uniref:TY-Chap C-terminal domain-containing protein n=1 Tax=Gordonia hydrophobica TaxID=40516 RepID=A0ABZ2TW92_9ACTN|nr:hypothetical protein [Gordonia hydrophobica]MBM7365906.1 hypothetical protein [Gordonia hydrophobica]